MKYGEKISAKIKKLIKEKGVKRTKIGEILGTPKDVTAQRKYSKFNNFLSNLKKDKIDFTALEQIASFLGKDVNWFLTDEEAVVPVSASQMKLVPFLGLVSNFKTNWKEEDVHDWLAYPFEINNGSKIFALEVCDDCMKPKINKGDIVFIDGNISGKMHDRLVLAYFDTENEPFLRRFLTRSDGMIELKCDNDLHGSIAINPIQKKIIISGIIKEKLAKL